MSLFFLLVIASLGSLIVLLAASIYLAASSPTSYQSSWMQEMWRHMSGMDGMMGGTPYTQSQSPVVSYLWVIPVALTVLAVAGVIGLAYFIAFPEIKMVKPVEETDNDEQSPQVSSLSPYSSVSKTLTSEERKVLDVLVSHDGKYLQKYIRKEAGLSRLKTHRILARLSERGIVALKKSGNTNEVLLSDWLRQGLKQEK